MEENHVDLDNARGPRWEEAEWGEINWETPLRVLLEKAPFIDPSDKQGHQLPISCRAPRWMGNMVSRVMDIRGSPYKSKSDLFRDAFYLGLHILAMRYDFSAEWQLESSASKIVSEHTMVSVEQERVEAFLKEISDDWHTGRQRDMVTSRFKRYVGEIIAMCRANNEGKKTHGRVYWSVLNSHPIVWEIAGKDERIVGFLKTGIVPK